MLIVASVASFAPRFAECAASFGVAALFAVSSLAFTIVKYAGAAYLICLGIQALRAPSQASEREGTRTIATLDLRRIFRDGFIVALLNPKTTIFFAAFLPQFIDAKGSVAAQSILLGAIFVAIGAVTDSMCALALQAASRLHSHAQGMQAQLGGTRAGLRTSAWDCSPRFLRSGGTKR